MKRFITTNYDDETHYIHSNPAQFLQFDNVFPITICLKPGYWKNFYEAELKILNYCKIRDINIKLYIENADSNVHYHGFASFPFEKTRKNFQVFISKSIGKYYQSTKKDYQDSSVWVRYCMKAEGYYNKELNDIINIYKSNLPDPRPAAEPNEDYIKYLRSHYGFDNQIKLPEQDEEVHTL